MKRAIRTRLLSFGCGIGLALPLLAPAAGKADPDPTSTTATPPTTTSTPDGTTPTTTSTPATTTPSTTTTTPASTTPTATTTTPTGTTSTPLTSATPATTPATTPTTIATLKSIPGPPAGGGRQRQSSSLFVLCSARPANAKANAKTKAKAKKTHETLNLCATNSRRHATHRKARPGAAGGAKTGSPTTVMPALNLTEPLLSFPAATLSMTDFFTDVPPFLLPIYEAAGIQYDVPWQVLAAINQVETDYGRNLSVSSAGAIGWMQFLPSTWKRYGVDATGSGYADPYNPVDAIFAAARYLHAAGASKHLARAIFAYNHASWYVQSVLLRAELIGGTLPSVTNGLTSLVDGRFPVAARATLARAGSTSATIFAPAGARVIAVSDGKVLAVGRDRELGRYLMLQDAAGNVYTYAHLGSLVQRYAVPTAAPSTAAAVAKQLGLPATPQVSTTPASGGTQTGTTPPSTSATARSTPSTIKSATRPASAGSAKERLFVYPDRPDSFASGGARQLSAGAATAAVGQSNASGGLHIAGEPHTLAPLRVGAIVAAGTLLGRVGASTPNAASGLEFKVKPSKAPYVDPESILNAWHLLDATSIYRARNGNPLLGGDPTIGLVLLMSERQLEQRVLSDQRIHIDGAGRLAIEGGLVDRRALAVLAFLSASGLNPTVSEISGGKVPAQPADVGDGGPTVEITKINGIPILGHQGSGSVTAAAIRLLLTLQGTLRPDQIISLMSYNDETNTLALPDHANRIQITFTPAHGAGERAAGHASSTLRPRQWTRLFDRLASVSEPGVPTARSTFAIKDTSDLTIAR